MHITIHIKNSKKVTERMHKTNTNKQAHNGLRHTDQEKIKAPKPIAEVQLSSNDRMAGSAL